MRPHTHECQHHYVFPTPGGEPTVTGVCKRCGAVKTAPTAGGLFFNFEDFRLPNSTPHREVLRPQPEDANDA